MEFNIRDRVIVRLQASDGETHRLGTVTGIAWKHIVTIYIVTMDNPLGVLFPEKEEWTTVAVPGGMLQKDYV